MLTRLRNGRWTTGLAAVVSTLVIAAGLPATAATTPVEATNRTGGTVTVSDDHVSPGQTLTVTGTGFTADPASGTTGQAVLAVKLNDSEYDGTFPWGFSGPSAVAPHELTGSSGSDGFAAIGIEDDGSFEVQFTVPNNWDEFGLTSFRFLGGSQTTGTKRLPIQSFSTEFAVVRPTQGFAWVTTTAHAQDSVNTSNASVRLRNFRSGADGQGAPQKVGVKIDGAGDIIACLQPDAQGDFDGTVTLPTKAEVQLTPGEHEFYFLAGTECVSGGSLTQGPGKNVRATFGIATHDITSTEHQPGGSVTTALTGFMNAAGTGGQKVALKITGEGYESEMTCITTDGFGKATGSAPLAADLPIGTYTLNALAGSACGTGSDMPGRSLQATFEVTAASTVTPKPKPGKIGVKKKATIKGKKRVKVGKKLTLTKATFKVKGVKAKYRWLRNGKVIKKATRKTYRTVRADKGKKIRVRITYTKPGFKKVTQKTNVVRVR